MPSRQVLSAAFCVVLVVSCSAAAEEKDPCRKEWQGQRLADSLYNLDLMVKLLGHLNGGEDLKLKRLIEINLQWAATTAREAIDHGAHLGSPYLAVNFLEPVHKAQLYASQHQLEGPSSTPCPKPDADLRENLEVVNTWLQKNQ